MLLPLDRIAFRIIDALPGCDDQFTELMFVRQPELDSRKRINPAPLTDASLPRFIG